MGASVTSFLDKRFSRQTSDGNLVYPVRLRVIFQRKPHIIGIKKAFCTPKEFNEMYTGRNLSSSLKKLKKKILEAEQKASVICDELGDDFNPDSFKVQLKGKTRSKVGFYDFWQVEIDELRKKGRDGTANSYQSALKKFRQFRPILSFRDLNKSLFVDFEYYVTSNSNRQDKARTSVGVYCRSIRAIINKAMKQRLMRSAVIFGKDGYVIPDASSHSNIAIGKDDLMKAVNFPFVGRKAFYRDMFYLQYLLNGCYPA
jgi:integrase/recombinase XerD